MNLTGPPYCSRSFERSDPVVSAETDLLRFSTFIAIILSDTPIARAAQLLDLKWPLPIRDFLRVYSELVGVVSTSDLLIHQSLANAGAFDSETGHSINC